MYTGQQKLPTSHRTGLCEKIDGYVAREEGRGREGERERERDETERGDNP